MSGIGSDDDDLDDNTEPQPDWSGWSYGLGVLTGGAAAVIVIILLNLVVHHS